MISKGHWRERGFIHGKFTQRFFDMQVSYKIILVLNEKFFRHVFNRLRSLIERRSYINSEKRQNNVTMRLAAPDTSFAPDTFRDSGRMRAGRRSRQRLFTAADGKSKAKGSGRLWPRRQSGRLWLYAWQHGRLQYHGRRRARQVVHRWQRLWLWGRRDTASPAKYP